MKMKDIYPSRYVKAADLQGREVEVVISDVVMEKIGDDNKPVIYFQNKDKGFVANKTNCGRIELAYGDDTDDWIGKPIVLGTEYVDFQGKSMEAIRVKPPKRRDGTVKLTPNGPKGPQHLVTDKGGYAISEMKPADLPPDGDPIPF